jgi:hypothetical protein
MLRRVAVVRTNVSKEPSASIFRVTRIDELGTTLAVTSKRNTLERNTTSNLICMLLVCLQSNGVAEWTEQWQLRLQATGDLRHVASTVPKRTTCLKHPVLHLTVRMVTRMVLVGPLCTFRLEWRAKGKRTEIKGERERERKEVGSKEQRREPRWKERGQMTGDDWSVN